EDKSANAHCHDDGDKEDFDVVAPFGVRVRFDPFVGGLLQFLHLVFQRFSGRAGGDEGAGLAQDGIQRLDGLRGENVSLGIEEFLDVLAQIARLAERGDKEPSKNRTWIHIAYVLSTSMNASCGMLTEPNDFIRFFPSFCFSSSLRFR